VALAGHIGGPLVMAFFVVIGVCIAHFLQERNKYG
jgi:hypothetical protein